MSTLLASRTAPRGLFSEFVGFLRSLILTPGTGGDESSTSFCWPRGL